MNRKITYIAAVVAAFLITAPTANASVLGDIQNNFNQAFNRILKITGFVASEKKDIKETPSETGSSSIANQKETAVGPGGAIYTISGGEGFPVFERELTVEPARSEIGKPQTFTVWVRDPSEVAIVKAIINTDKGDKEVILTLSDGSSKEGKWKGSWNAEGIQVGQYYKIMFEAVGKSGGKAEMPFLTKAKTK